MMSVSREHGAFSSFQLELELKARKGSVLHAQARCWYEHANGRLIRAAVRAIQYFPEIQHFYRSTARRKPKAVARALVAKELARAVYFVLTRQGGLQWHVQGPALNSDQAAEVATLGEPAR